MPRRLILALLLWAPGGCDDADGVQLQEREDMSLLPDVSVFDAQLVDARAGCRPSPEVCNTIDDDCDGLVDGDDPDLQRLLLQDPDNCGACDRACAAPNADLACQAGGCVIIGCAPGFGDYNGELADGCEADCVITAGGTEICDAQDNDCDGEVDEGFDLSGDLEHCGRCNAACPLPEAATAVCVEGECAAVCDAGFVDLDDDLANGCEYACEVRGTEMIREYCNGLDDDCDGAVDEAADLVVPDDTCGDEGICARTCEADEGCGDGEICADGLCVLADPPVVDCAEDAECQALHRNLACVAGQCVPRRHGFMCDGVAGYRCVRPVGWQFGDELGACDGADNDCDGRVDEDFVEALFAADRETPRACFVGLGVCQREGLALCAADGDGVACSVEPGRPEGEGDDDCDGDDDDCDGRLDEGFADAWVRVGGVSIYAYEASRPGASAEAPGRDVREDDVAVTYISGRACSRPGVLPWADVTWEAAAEACALADARLCTGEEWARACGGPAGQAFPYGPEYQPRVCNDGPHDASPEPGRQDQARLTGALARCVRDGAFDLSGNLKEWTADAVDDLRVVRGGGFESHVPAGLMCGQAGDLKDPEFRHAGIGFRCCR